MFVIVVILAQMFGEPARRQRGVVVQLIAVAASTVTQLQTMLHC